MQVQVLSPAPKSSLTPIGVREFFVMKGLEGGAVVNDSLNGCQSRGVTEPAGETKSCYPHQISTAIMIRNSIVKAVLIFIKKSVSKLCSPILFFVPISRMNEWLTFVIRLRRKNFEITE